MGIFADNPKHIIHLFFIIIYVREILTEQCGVLPARRMFDTCNVLDDSYVSSRGTYVMHVSKDLSDCTCRLVVPPGITLKVDDTTCLDVTCIRPGNVGVGSTLGVPPCSSRDTIRVSRSPLCPPECGTVTTKFWFLVSGRSQSNIRITCGLSMVQQPPIDIAPPITCSPDYDVTEHTITVPSQAGECGSREDSSEEFDDVMAGPYAMLPSFDTVMEGCNCKMEIPSGVELHLHTPGPCVQVGCSPRARCSYTYNRGVYEVRSSQTTWYNLYVTEQTCTSSSDCNETYIMVKPSSDLRPVVIKFKCGVPIPRDPDMTSSVTESMQRHKVTNSRSTTEGLIVGLVIGVLLALLIGMVIGCCFNKRLKRCVRYGEDSAVEAPATVIKPLPVDISVYDSLVTPDLRPTGINLNRQSIDGAAGIANYTYIDIDDLTRPNPTPRQALPASAESGTRDSLAPPWSRYYVLEPIHTQPPLDSRVTSNNTNSTDTDLTYTQRNDVIAVPTPNSNPGPLPVTAGAPVVTSDVKEPIYLQMASDTPDVVGTSCSPMMQTADIPPLDDVAPQSDVLVDNPNYVSYESGSGEFQEVIDTSTSTRDSQSDYVLAVDATPAVEPYAVNTAHVIDKTQDGIENQDSPNTTMDSDALRMDMAARRTPSLTDVVDNPNFVSFEEEIHM